MTTTPNSPSAPALPKPAAWALQLAAQAWSHPSCSDIKMDGRLGNVFARMLTRLAASFEADREAGRASGASVAVPDGFVLVPREITPAMIDAWCKYHTFEGGYRAMISAAPAAVLVAAPKLIDHVETVSEPGAVLKVQVLHLSEEGRACLTTNVQSLVAEEALEDGQAEGEPSLNGILAIADEESEDSMENGDRLFTREGIAKFARRMYDRGAQAAPEAGMAASMRSRAVRFVTGADGRVIDDDDFTHDASLKITGDFGSDEDRRMYSQWLCDRLNVTPLQADAPKVAEAPAPQAVDDEQRCQELRALGWQAIKCPACGSDGAVGYPRAAPQAVVGEASEARIAGALFDFLGFLTTSEEQWKFSAYDDASPAVLALEQWAAKRGFALEPADVPGWRAALTSPAPSTAPHQGADALREDAERLDFLQAWADKSIAQGFKWDNYVFTNDVPIREQLDAAIEAARAALAQHQAPQQGEQHV